MFPPPSVLPPSLQIVIPLSFAVFPPRGSLHLGEALEGCQVDPETAKYSCQAGQKARLDGALGGRPRGPPEAKLTSSFGDVLRKGFKRSHVLRF